MAQRSKKGSLLSSLSSLPTDNASAEAPWRQALLLRELSRDERVTARKRRAEAEAAKEYAENEAITATKQLCAELSNSVKIREDAEVYSEEVQNSARTAAETLMTQTRAGADEMASRMRRETSEDIRKILTDVEVARASAEDELETQRILTETARVRAFSHGLAAENASEELARTNKPAAKPAPAKVKVVRKTKVVAKKATSGRKAKLTSIRKAA
jgi:hypothetical protein